MNINYSVIIPFKGEISLLQKACASIPCRDDVQIIIVDNSQEHIGLDVVSSLENSNQILYLISSSFKGAGHARNKGLEKATGKYLLFLDADDYFAENAFDYFDRELGTDYDVIYYNTLSIKLQSHKPSKRHKEIDRIIKFVSKTGNEDLVRYQYVTPYCKMIRRTLVTNNHILFQETPVSNDVMFSAMIGYFAEKIRIVDYPAYIITEGPKGTSLTKMKTRQNQFIRFQVIIDHSNFVKSVGHPDMSFRISSFIFHAIIDFGFIEGYKWLKYAIKQNAFLKVYCKSTLAS